MKYLIVADSSADFASRVPPSKESLIKSVPLKIITSAKEYVDDDILNVNNMVSELEAYNGRSSSSCPSPVDWLDAFGDADLIFCITITSGLSGSYNAACIAKNEYEEQHPDRKVFVIDSLSTGPEMGLIADKIIEFINSDIEFYETCEMIKDYQEKTGLLFILESMKNLANNGRVSPLVAKLAGLLGIRVIGKASDAGTLEQLGKCRGEEKTLQSLFKLMKELGYCGGKVKISNCLNPNAANRLSEIIHAVYNSADIEIYECRGLCSFYAERGGILVGFEKA